MTDIISATSETIQSQIYTIRGKQVMVDRDLALLYGVETRILNQAVKRNIERFPDENFMFRLDDLEFKNWRSQFVISNSDKQGLRYIPFCFTEVGIIMLSTVLRSTTAINVSIKITHAFVQMRRFLKDNADVFVRLDTVERKQVIMQHETDQKFEKIFNALQSPDVKPRQGIFYDGQVFDAYTFIADLVREAQSSIVLIDNYVDDSVLRMFVKRAKGVLFTIYTQKISSQLVLDLQKHNAQYEPVVIHEFKAAHDRFLILDGAVVYHIGASLKDLGKKWFAFSKMDISALDMLGKLI